MKNIGIKYQLRLTTLIPVLLVALLFALFYNGQFNKDLEHHNARLGEAYIRQLLPAAQLALLRDDKRILQGLIDASAINQEIQALAFYNNKGQLLAYRGGKHSLKKPFTPPEFTGDYVEKKAFDSHALQFIAPITVPKFNLYSMLSYRIPNNWIDFQADDVLGWLSINIDTRGTLIKRYQMYIVTIFITLFGLLLSLSIHYLLSKTIYLPITRLRRSMKQILSNEFETEIKVTSPGELGIIESGCAHLQRHYLSMVQDMNHHVEVATEDLQKNLELLEEKNIQLSLEKKKSDEKNRQKSEFIANMSHEIRTPMNGVIGFTNVLLESSLDPLQQEYVKTIKSSAQDLLVIINDILDYSKIEAGKLQLDCIPVDLRACIDEVMALQSPSAHKKGLDFIASTSPEVPKTILGDPLRLKQIIGNLISNAVKFTAQGYVLIRTTIEGESEKDYSINIAVIDTGIGIHNDHQTTLFNAFNQADTSITRRFGGSGLGLVITKKLVENMNGRISLKSEPYKGSTFTLHLKLEKLAAYEVEKHQAHRFGHLKVLCFDDNPLYMEALHNGLRFWGIECVCIHSFQALKQAFYQHPDCDLAFISVNQGCEQQVADILHHQSIFAVLLSKWVIQNVEALGAQACLFKPPNIQKLHETIESFLNHCDMPTKQPSLNGEQEELTTLRRTFSSLNPRLLIAEDNAINRRLLHSLLGTSAQIQTVEDGQQAIQHCHQDIFDIILLDLQMPRVNGLEAARLIHQQCLLNRKTPIILISANNINKNHDYLQKIGIHSCLEKPINEKELLRHLLAILTSDKNEAINWPMCIEKASGNATLAFEFLTDFIEELKNNRQEFIQLLREEQVDKLEKAAHKLHGACCFCGVPLLQMHVASLESLTRQTTDMLRIIPIATQVLEQIEAVIAEYNQLFLKTPQLTDK